MRIPSGARVLTQQNIVRAYILDTKHLRLEGTGGELNHVNNVWFIGLDIATNKITEEETQGVPHHLMSFVDATTARYNIHQFRVLLFQEIRSRGRIPIVVGGTAYYVESLLFEENIIETPGNRGTSVFNRNSRTFSSSFQIDPESARLVHPNNRSRVLRAIERSYFQVLSLDARKEVLIERLDRRVEKMKQMGLRKELEEYYDTVSIYAEHFGVLQCIGLKEFIPYLELSKEERFSAEGERLFQKGCDDVKVHTRQYARRQRNWVNSRFVRRQEIREVRFLFIAVLALSLLFTDGTLGLPGYYLNGKSEWPKCCIWSEPPLPGK
ncbi:unnamed protein product [Heligmosomoides polygyrus]|uniref:tRNA dimethylallyltransferase n=1 Tax=Heligmosomoides polygyrus TaxID=6339 RepID=A0A183GNS2_HELPZ|nr:unnamed protein product [Heligmosomoides polygyrus]